MLGTCTRSQVLHTTGAVVMQFPALGRAREPGCCPACGGEASESAENCAELRPFASFRECCRALGETPLKGGFVAS